MGKSLNEFYGKSLVFTIFSPFVNQIHSAFKMRGPFINNNNNYIHNNTFNLNIMLLLKIHKIMRYYKLHRRDKNRRRKKTTTIEKVSFYLISNQCLPVKSKHLYRSVYKMVLFSQKFDNDMKMQYQVNGDRNLIRSQRTIFILFDDEIYYQ